MRSTDRRRKVRTGQGRSWNRQDVVCFHGSPSLLNDEAVASSQSSDLFRALRLADARNKSR